MMNSSRNAQWLATLISEFTLNAPQNSLGLGNDEKAFDAPLVGFSNAADQLYDFYRSHIGPFYLTPLVFFQHHFPCIPAMAEELTVISWILPSTARTREEQAVQQKYPSERWARTRALGEDFNICLRRYVVNGLARFNIPALAPVLSPLWSRSDEGKYAPCSNWSERHAAYAAGLGTFGLCDGLITPLGKAVRVGSVIAKIPVTPSKRPYNDHHAYCQHFTARGCRECIERCPVSAISENGHDKKRCMQYTERIMHQYIKEHYNLDTYACGLCQAGVPCTSRIPKVK